MADLLTHLLVGFVLGTGLSFRYDWVDSPFVTVVMTGALLPDLTKVNAVFPSARVEAILGTPFDWFALHTPVGTIVVAGIASLLVDETHRRRVFVLLLIGAASHFSLDAMLISPSRFSHVLLWPVFTVHIPLPTFYLSSDRWPVVAAFCTALIVWCGQWYVDKG